jgi:hypothetical protein
MKICIDIGTHKTRSTSIQGMLAANRGALREKRWDFYLGSILRDNHVELTQVFLRDHVEKMIDYSPEATKLAALTYDNVRSQTQNFVAACEAHGFEKLIFSCESLSLLRNVNEVDRLKNLFPTTCKVTIVVVLRNKGDFIESYRRQILKFPGRNVSNDPRSSLYVAENNWVSDFDALLACYGKVFNEIVTIEYLKINVTVIFLNAVGWPDDATLNFNFRLNKTSESLAFCEESKGNFCLGFD